MRVGLFVAILIVSTVVFSEGPNPSGGVQVQPPKPQRAQGKKAAQTDQRGTENAPLVVKGFPPPAKSHDETDREQKERDEKTANERGLTVYTGYLAILTGGLVVVAFIQACLFLWQLSLMRAGAKDSERVAEAARIQAKAAVNLRLPVLRAVLLDDLMSLGAPMPEHGAFGGGNSGVPHPKHSAVGLFKFRNVGRTVAFPLRLAVGHCVATDLPAVPVYSHTFVAAHSAVISPDGDYEPHDWYYGINLTDAEVQAANVEGATFWVYGALSYTDLLEEEETTFRFCWRRVDQNEGQGGAPMYGFESRGNPPRAYIAKTTKKLAS